MILRELINLIKFKVDEKSLRATEQKLNKVIGGLNQFGMKATFMLTGPIAALTALSVKSASDATEIQNKFNQVFGELNTQANQFAETFSKSVGRFKGDTQESLSAIQSMSIGLGYTNQVSLETSKRVQKLIVDFGSFNNLQDAEAQRRFLSALAGSAQVMDMYGINLKAAALDQELLAMGIGKTSAKAGEAEKFLARIGIIEKTMTRQGAVGDAIRTLDEFANRSRAAMSRVKAVFVSFGEKIVPVLNKFLAVGIKVLDWLEGMSDRGKRMVLIVAGILALIGPLTLGLAGLLSVVKGLMLFSSFLGGLAGLKSMGLMLLQPQFLLIAGAILVAVAALALFIEDVMIWAQGGDSLLGKLLGPWDMWAKNLKEMFSLMVTDFGLFGKAMGMALIDGLSGLSEELEKTAFGRIMKWVSLIKPAEILGEGLGTMTANLSTLGKRNTVGRAAEDLAFESYNRKVRESRVTVESTINMQVPQGTQQEQIAAVEDAAKNAAKKTFSNEVLRLFDNEVQ